MGWGQKRHPLEVIIVALSIALFAGGIGVATWAVLGKVAVTIAAGVAASAGGWAFVERAGRTNAAPAPAFAPPEVDADILLLDDPLPPPNEGSRVVRLFETDAVNATPGELLTRIGDYLGQRVGSPTLAGPPVQPAPDASAELYAALANIRASLR